MPKEYAVGAQQASSAGSSTPVLLTEELDLLVREGARQMIAAMLEVEVNEFLQRALSTQRDGARLSQWVRAGTHDRGGRGRDPDSPTTGE